MEWQDNQTPSGKRLGKRFGGTHGGERGCGRYVRLCDRRQRRGGLGAGAPADRGAGRHGLRAGSRPAGSASRTSTCRPGSSRCCSTRTSPGSSRPSPPKAAAGGRSPPPRGARWAGPARSTAWSTTAGSAPISTVGRSAAIAAGAMSTCCPTTSAPSGGSASPMTASMAARATCRSPTSTGSTRSARRSSTARSAWVSRAAPTTTAATGSMASAISSARSIAAGGTRLRACSCIRRRRPDGWRSAPMPAPPRCCSTAGAPAACAMSMIAIASTQHVVQARREVILSLRHRQYGEAAADLRRRAGRGAGLDRRSGGA